MQEEFSNQRLLLGTHGPSAEESELNQVQIHKLKMPVDHAQVHQKDNKSMYDRTEKIMIDQEIYHDGEVNKARHMPQSHNIIATKTASGEVHVFDYFKHPSKPTDWGIRPNLRLVGHNSEGYGLSWNPLQDGILLSGSDDGIICIWDINQLSKQDSN